MYIYEHMRRFSYLIRTIPKEPLNSEVVHIAPIACPSAKHPNLATLDFGDSWVLYGKVLL